MFQIHIENLEKQVHNSYTISPYGKYIQ